MGWGSSTRRGCGRKFAPSLESLSSLGFRGQKPGNPGCPGNSLLGCPGPLRVFKNVVPPKVRAHFSFPRVEEKQQHKHKHFSIRRPGGRIPGKEQFSRTQKVYARPFSIVNAGNS